MIEPLGTTNKRPLELVEIDLPAKRRREDVSSLDEILNDEHPDDDPSELVSAPEHHGKLDSYPYRQSNLHFSKFTTLNTSSTIFRC